MPDNKKCFTQSWSMVKGRESAYRTFRRLWIQSPAPWKREGKKKERPPEPQPHIENVFAMTSAKMPIPLWTAADLKLIWGSRVAILKYVSLSSCSQVTYLSQPPWVGMRFTAAPLFPLQCPFLKKNLILLRDHFPWVFRLIYLMICFLKKYELSSSHTKKDL